MDKAGKCKVPVVRSMLLFGQQKPGLIRGILPDTSNTEVGLYYPTLQIQR